MRIIVPGNPVPLKRPRFSKRSSKVYNSQSKEMIANSLVIASQWNEEKITGPVSIYIVFFMKIPKHLSKIKKIKLSGSYHYIRPDIDNLEKKLLDEIVLSDKILMDDSQISIVSSQKIYSENPRTEFIVNKI